ncbi:MAG: uncharacterized protein QOF09_3227 [Alphaproteobacteria bacterium]|jgi:hypothetical protein|nr:uncharacterized protein [Alphaproteobacteria bacterium]
MIVHPAVRVLGAAAVACFALVHDAQAQQPQAQQPRVQQAPAQQPRPRVPQAPAQPPQAQQPEPQRSQAEQLRTPSAAAVALATQLLELKGGIGAYDPAVEGVILHHRGILLQINPNLTRDVDATVQVVRAEAAARRQELHDEIARGYASAFSEQDLKDMIQFYKTPLGRKMIEAEPKAGEESTRRAQVWIDKYAEEVISKMRAEMKKRGHTEF